MFEYRPQKLNLPVTVRKPGVALVNKTQKCMIRLNFVTTLAYYILRRYLSVNDF